MMSTHPVEAKLPYLVSIEMLASSEDNITDVIKIIFMQKSWHTVVQSN